MRKVFIITACIIAVAALPGSAPATDQGKAAHPQVFDPPPRTAPASVDRPDPPVAPVAASPAKPATALSKAAPMPQSQARPPAPQPAAKVMARQQTTSSKGPAQPKQIQTAPGQTSGPPRLGNIKPVPQNVHAAQPKPEISLVRKLEQAPSAKPAIAVGPNKAPIKELTPGINSAHTPVSHKPVRQLKATVAPDKFRFRNPEFNRLVNQQRKPAVAKAGNFAGSPQRAQVRSASPAPVQSQRPLRPRTVAMPRTQAPPAPSKLKASAGLQVPIKIRLNSGPRPKAVPTEARTVPSTQKFQTRPAKVSPISKPLAKTAPVGSAATVRQSPVPKQIPVGAKPETGKCECKPCPRVSTPPTNLTKQAQQVSAPAVVAPKQIPIPKRVLPAAKTGAQPKQVAKSAHVVAQPKARVQRRQAPMKQTGAPSSPASVPTVEANSAPPAAASKWTETPASAGQRPPVQNQTQTPSVQR